MSGSKESFAIAPLPRRGSLVDDIVAVLRARVISGELAVGDQLPAESRLAEAFQVSRTIIREALARLKQEGLVESQQGRGVFILRTSPEPPSIFDKGGQSTASHLRHVFELRLAIEPAAAAHAATRWTPQTLADINESLTSLRTATEDGLGGPETDWQFHLSIANAAQNPFFVSLLEFIGKEMIAFIRTARENTKKVSGRPILVHSEHEGIYNAILDRDPAAASDAMRSHLRRAAIRLSVNDSGLALQQSREI